LRDNFISDQKQFIEVIQPQLEQEGIDLDLDKVYFEFHIKSQHVTTTDILPLEDLSIWITLRGLMLLHEFHGYIDAWHMQKALEFIAQNDDNPIEGGAIKYQFLSFYTDICLYVRGVFSVYSFKGRWEDTLTNPYEILNWSQWCLKVLKYRNELDLETTSHSYILLVKELADIALPATVWVSNTPVPETFEKQIWQKELEYAKLVKGALINVNIRIVWGPTNPTTTIDSEAELKKVAWESVSSHMEKYINMRAHHGYGIASASLTKELLRYKAEVIDSLFQKDEYVVTSEVQMVEFEVIYRLSNDGVFPWLENGKPVAGHDMKTLVQALRWSDFRYQFASVVGKRMMTERLIQSGRTNIVEHHRSSAWAEREYTCMCQMMDSNVDMMNKAIATTKELQTKARAEDKRY
jgi:hypothetical protein